MTPPTSSSYFKPSEQFPMNRVQLAPHGIKAKEIQSPYSVEACFESQDRLGKVPALVEKWELTKEAFFSLYSRQDMVWFKNGGSCEIQRLLFSS